MTTASAPSHHHRCYQPGRLQWHTEARSPRAVEAGSELRLTGGEWNGGGVAWLSVRRGHTGLGRRGWWRGVAQCQTEAIGVGRRGMGKEAVRLAWGLGGRGR